MYSVLCLLAYLAVCLICLSLIHPSIHPSITIRSSSIHLFIIISPSIARRKAYVLPTLLSFIIIFFLTVSLETNYLKMYCIDLHQIFRIGARVGMINPIFFAIVQETLLR